MSEEFKDTLAEVITSWNRQHIELNGGLSDEQLHSLETKLEFTFEPDFKGYLRATNGFDNYDWDEAMITFWPASMILEEAGNFHPKELICFADHCINLCSFGYHREKKGIYIHYQHTEGIAMAASSFADFMKLYLTDPYAIIIHV